MPKKRKKTTGKRLTPRQKLLQIYTICYGASFEELTDEQCIRTISSIQKVLDSNTSS